MHARFPQAACRVPRPLTSRLVRRKPIGLLAPLISSLETVSRGPALRRRAPRVTANIVAAAITCESMCRMTRASDVFSPDRHQLRRQSRANVPPSRGAHRRAHSPIGGLVLDPVSPRPFRAAAAGGRGGRCQQRRNQNSLRRHRRFHAASRPLRVIARLGLRRRPLDVCADRPRAPTEEQGSEHGG
jgi:hypothetical protein